METPIKMDDLGVPLFSETPISAIGICKEHNEQLHRQRHFSKAALDGETMDDQPSESPCVWGGKLCTMHGEKRHQPLTWPLMCGVKRVALPGKTSMKRSFIEFQESMELC